MTATIIKDPAAVLDYTFDWAAWLSDGENITAHTVTTPTGITLDSNSESGGVVVAWLSGGTVGTDYRVVCQVTTNQGRTDERTLTIACHDR